ncbi:Uncharacterised protein [Legionella steigerwaltii]|uniref:Uncharacterized protein n=2 Tax=Legionella steigerwaltii TaxID=460 RepID=A0A378LAA9_9GAMM|nr:hypothetical protein Lstg_2300 [Legionella steigerwaltii]STY22808.1 Uncharacterised protein [Legionella steigerwaltii]
MSKYRSLILLFVMSAVFLAPLKLPTCPKQNVQAPVIFAFSVTPCSMQQAMNSSCFSSSYWLQDEFHLAPSWIVRSLIGLLSFLLIYSKYNSPLDEIYRPPI